MPVSIQFLNTHALLPASFNRNYIFILNISSLKSASSKAEAKNCQWIPSLKKKDTLRQWNESHLSALYMELHYVKFVWLSLFVQVHRFPFVITLKTLVPQVQNTHLHLRHNKKKQTFLVFKVTSWILALLFWLFISTGMNSRFRFFIRFLINLS